MEASAVTCCDSDVSDVSDGTEPVQYRFVSTCQGDRFSQEAFEEKVAQRPGPSNLASTDPGGRVVPLRSHCTPEETSAKNYVTCGQNG